MLFFFLWILGNCYIPLNTPEIKIEFIMIPYDTIQMEFSMNKLLQTKSMKQ